MSQKSLIILLCIMIQMKGKDESFPTYSTLNGFETIFTDQDFIIQTNVKSIAYFDSVDKGSVIYISKDYNSYKDKKDERINGKFYEIEANTLYYVRNSLYFPDSPSVFKKYLNPLNLQDEPISIYDDYSISYLYLQKEKVYTLDFKNKSIKKMITLSKKTLNSRVKIKNLGKEVELNQTNLYCYLNVKGQLTLEIKENDAFLEFHYSIEGIDYEKIAKTELNHYELIKSDSIIIIPYTQKNLNFRLYSDSLFHFSFSYDFSYNTNYYQKSKSNIGIPAKLEVSWYRAKLQLYGIFKNFTLLNNECFYFYIKIYSSYNDPIYLSYSLESQIDILLDEEVDSSFCQYIIKNIQDMLDLYVYTDISQAPPKIENYPNYHHKKINLKNEIGKISTTNRNFYEFYQDIKKILTTVKDLHSNFYPEVTPAGIEFYKYHAYLPFDFIIKENNNDYKIYIKKNNYYSSYGSRTQNFIDKHLNIPLKSINDMDPFDYIQNWSKFRATKNQHSQFTFIIDLISDFYIYDFPLNFSDISLNDYEFEDNQLLRIPYLCEMRIWKSLAFNNYFSNIFNRYQSKH